MLPSELWSRRKSAINHFPPHAPLAPLATSTNTLPPSALAITTQDSDSQARLSSPALYTPTEASTILLCSHPVIVTDGQAAEYESLSAAATAAACLAREADGRGNRLCPTITTPLYAPPDGVALVEDLHLEIDMASLGTEMALSLLESDSDLSASSTTVAYCESQGRLRLLPFTCASSHPSPFADQSECFSPLAPSSGSTLCTLPTSGTTSASEGNPDCAASIVAVKPVARKRARMSQEKRRRLARRREREALFMNLAQPETPRTASAPLYRTFLPQFGTAAAGKMATAMHVPASSLDVEAGGGGPFPPALSLQYFRAQAALDGKDSVQSPTTVWPPYPSPLTIRFAHVRPPIEMDKMFASSTSNHEGPTAATTAAHGQCAKRHSYLGQQTLTPFRHHFDTPPPLRREAFIPRYHPSQMYRTAAGTL